MARGSEPLSLRFKERMSGHLVFDHLDELIRANDDGTGWVGVGLRMDMHIADVDAFWAGSHIGDLRGTVECAALGGALSIHEGHFQLMVPSDDGSHQHMNYVIEFEDGNGRPLTLQGYKEVAPGEFGPWEDTTTTLCRVHRGWVSDFDKWDVDAPASGVLRIRLRDFLWQELTFRAEPGSSLRTRVHVHVKFAWRFVVSLWKAYGPGHPRRSGPGE